MQVSHRSMLGAHKEHAERSNIDSSSGSTGSKQISRHIKRPRRLRAKYTHRTNLTIYALCISPCGAVPLSKGGTQTAKDLWITGAGPWKSARTAGLPIPLFHSPAASPVTHKLLSRNDYHPDSGGDSDEK